MNFSTRRISYRASIFLVISVCTVLVKSQIPNYSTYNLNNNYNSRQQSQQRSQIPQDDYMNLRKRFGDGNYNNDDRIHYPGAELESRLTRSEPKEKVKVEAVEEEIPSDIMAKFNNITSLDEFFNSDLIDKGSIDEADGISSRFGNVERSAGTVPKPALCATELQTVKLIDTNEANVVYFPSCTRLKQCSGCCQKFFTCRPTQTETKTFILRKSRYDFVSHKFQLEGKEVVVVDEHLQCKCECSVRAEHCNPYQVYDKSECKCTCKNYDEQRKCTEDGRKIWDSQACQCRCRNITECTTGTYFDPNQCRCIDIPPSGLSPATITDRKRFILKAVPKYPQVSTISTPFT